MIQRFDVWFNNVSLQSVCPSARILDIKYKAVQWSTTAEKKALGQGMIRTARNIPSASVSITVQVREYDPASRQYALMELAKWADGDGYLETSDRPGQRLYCSCDTVPMVSSALRWLDAVNIVFMAYEKPFWEDKIINYVTINKPSASTVYGNIWGAGVADNPYLEGVITIKAGTATQVTVNVVDIGFMLLDGISIAPGKTIEFGTDNNGIFYAKSDGSGLLSKLAPSSADDLRIKKGVSNRIVFATQGATSAELNVGARGLYY